jgi:hypothetical protein
MENPYESYTECFINFQRIPYDACGTGIRKECKKSYKNFKYIGSGYIYWVNNVIQSSNTEHHFFQRKKENEKFVLLEKV